MGPIGHESRRSLKDWNLGQAAILHSEYWRGSPGSFFLSPGNQLGVVGAVFHIKYMSKFGFAFDGNWEPLVGCKILMGTFILRTFPCWPITHVHPCPNVPKDVPRKPRNVDGSTRSVIFVFLTFEVPIHPTMFAI